MNSDLDNQLKSLGAEARVLFVISELKRRGAVSAEDALLLRKNISQTDPSVRLILSLAKNNSSFDDLKTYLVSYLQDISGPEEPGEDFSPNTRQAIQNAEADTSPLGNLLVYKKIAHQQKNSDRVDFALNLLDNRS